MAKKPCGCEDKKTFGKARIRPNGLIQYPKKGIEPPPDIDGYERMPGDPWSFRPLWPVCQARLQNQFLRKCGAIGLITLCTHPDGPKENRQEVTFEQCTRCTLK